MAKKIDFGEELTGIKDYLINASNENAKRKFVYPLFVKRYGDKFKVESDAQGADGYVEGIFVLELKSKPQDWLAGFYQALHYQKKGLSFPAVIVLCEGFIAVWRLERIPEFAAVLAHKATPSSAANEVGKDLAKRTNKAIAQEILDSAVFKMDKSEIEKAKMDLQLTKEMYNFLQILNNIHANRISINPTNFINTIDILKKFFVSPIEAAHGFYTMIGYWDITSTISENEDATEMRLVGYKGKKMSAPISISSKNRQEFIKFIEDRYIFTNEGSGLGVDYYFSRFDEVLAQIDPAYVKQHGIFFTDDNLSKFALWYAEALFTKDLGEKYIAFDPAGGSGNLMLSYRGKLKHKIVCELQPDLLRIIEKRMMYDPYHIETGFTVIPKTSENKGLNFLDKTGEEYLNIIAGYLAEKHIKLDKPLAFLLNPPYKNTDENTEKREEKNANYGIHQSILTLTGEDAGKERYLAFLAQIMNICKYQKELYPEVSPILMVFTPTSWLIPRPTYQPFREVFDDKFAYLGGFITSSNEFFKLEGKWPIAFTIWKYEPNSAENKRQNRILIHDFTHLKHNHLAQIDWDYKELSDVACKTLAKKVKIITLDNSRGDIRAKLPTLTKNGKKVPQPRLNIYRNKSKEEKNQKIISGFPLKDNRHQTIKDPYGYNNGDYIGFMDDNTPVRIKQDTCFRLSHDPNRVWLRLDIAFADINKTRITSSTPSVKGFCCYDINTAKFFFSWFAISKALNGRYPIWANQYDLWQPKIKIKAEKYYYSLCFAFALAENRCVVTKFEANNPVPDSPEIFVDNPLCPTHSESFWATTLDKEIVKEAIKGVLTDEKWQKWGENPAVALVEAIKDLYRFWNSQYCKGKWIYSLGLHDEPYFRYFDYADFLTPHAGLLQIRKYSEIHAQNDLLERLQEINVLSKIVKEEIYRLLVDDFGYFDA